MPSQAITIHYQATDLPDTVFGFDQWRYEYTVSEYNFAVDTGFVIFFDPLLYADLQDPPPVVNSDWDVLVIDPIPFVPDDGSYDALALTDNPSVLDLFTIDFVWLGSGLPSAQSFEIYNNTFTVIESGSTFAGTSSVPILPGFLLFGSGIFAVLGLCRKPNSICSTQQKMLKEKLL